MTYSKPSFPLNVILNDPSLGDKQQCHLKTWAPLSVQRDKSSLLNNNDNLFLYPAEVSSSLCLLFDYQARRTVFTPRLYVLLWGALPTRTLSSTLA